MDPVEIAFLDILPSLTDAVALEPDNFANQLMKRGLIPKRIWQNSLSSSVQPFDKSNQLMVAIQTRLSSDHAAVNPLSDALRSIPTLSPFADRLLTAMGQRETNCTSMKIEAVKPSTYNNSPSSSLNMGTVTSSSSEAEGLDYEPDHIELVDKVVPQLCSRWKAMARQLELTMNEIDDIQEQELDNISRITKVLDMWRDLKRVPYTWKHLIFILNKNAIRERVLANELEQSLTKRRN